MSGNSKDDLLRQDWSEAWETLAEAPPLVPRRKTAQMTLRLPASLLARIKRVAASRSLPHHALVRSWIVDGLRQPEAPDTYEVDQPHAKQLNIKLSQDVLDELKARGDELRRPYHRLARDWIEAAIAQEEMRLGLDQRSRAKDPPQFADPDAWQRMLATIRLPQQQLRDLIKASYVPHQQLGALLKATRVPRDQLRTITEASAIPQSDLQKMIDATRIPNEDLQRAIRGARITDERWRDVLRSTGFHTEQFQAALEGASLSRQQWQQMIEATRFSQRLPQQVQELVASLEIPRSRWQETLDLLREVGVESIGEAAEELGETIDAAQPEADPNEARVSWLLNLPFVYQLGLYLAVLKALDELGKFLETLTDGEVSPELRAATQVLFAVCGVLLMVIQLRSPPPGGG